MTAYYTDNDPGVCAWVEALIADGALPPGAVDCCDVCNADPGDAVHAHFFAGIAGWAHALDMAGWPSDTPVWTASLPCQPFSSAGRQRGVDDERHLWPIFRGVIRKYRPAVIFGEQVANEAGRNWLTDLFTDFQNMGYVTAGADLCGACVGAPQNRPRLYWMAYSAGRWKRADWEAVQGAVGGRDDPGIFWAGHGKILAGDGFQRRVRPFKPGIQLMASRVPGAVVLLRGAGNSIIPQVAEVFVKSCVDAMVDSYETGSP